MVHDLDEAVSWPPFGNVCVLSKLPGLVTLRNEFKKDSVNGLPNLQSTYLVISDSELY